LNPEEMKRIAIQELIYIREVPISITSAVSLAIFVDRNNVK